jgi:4-nitrophenyl phosphatase
MNQKNKNIKALILDMDGVLWRGPEPIGNLPDVFERIFQLGLKTILATNNSTRTVDQFIDKLGEFGVELNRWQVITSSQAAVTYLMNKYPDGGPVYMIGEKGLSQALKNNEFYMDESSAKAVIIGMDSKLTYGKLKKATLLIRSGADFIGTNPDRTFPSPEGLVPGAGSIIASLEAATDINPVITGKPEPEMYKQALSRLCTQPQETLVVGDRPETDIAGGQQLGCLTALVLSGVTSMDQAKAWEPKPDFITTELTDLISLLEKNS